MLEIDNFSVKYKQDTEWIIKELSVNIESNQLVLIVGASGSGKSTLAKAIMGIIPYFERGNIEGKIIIDGKNTLTMPRKDLINKIGYISQYPADFTIQMLVEDEIAFPLENLGIESSIIEEKVNEILELLDISHIRYKLMTELSSGELQRVALATAIIASPPLLILDEPFSRIDPKSEMIFASLLRRMADRDQCIIVFDHRLDYILPYADKVIYLSNGKKSIEGTSREVISYLSDVDVPEVSEIINPMNKNQFLTIEQAIESLKVFFDKE